MNRAFVHTFETTLGYYVYDVNSNSIVRVEEVVSDILKLGDTSALHDFVSLLGKKHDSGLVEKGVEEVQQYRLKRNLFSDRRPQGLADPVCERHFHENLSRGLTQLILNISERCNLRCRYCVYSGLYHYERQHSARIMPFEVAKRVVDFFHAHSRASEKIYIGLYGGEPLTNLDTIKKTVEYIKGNHVWQPLHLSVDTNGTLLTDEVIKFLVKHDFIIQISVDGPATIHDKYRVHQNGSGTYKGIWRNLQRIRDLSEEYYGEKVSFSVTLAPPYDLIERYNFFSSNGLVPNVLSSVFVSSFDTDFFRVYYDQAGDSEILEELARLRKLYIETKARTGQRNAPRFLASLFEAPIIRIHRRELTSMPDKCAANGICLPGQRRLFVSTSGKFYPCEKIGEAFCIGDVERGLDLVAIRSLVDNYIDISSEDCTNCWAVRLCRLCFVDAKKGTRLDIDRKRERCAQEKQIIHEALVNYAEVMENNPNAYDFVKEMVFE